MRLDAALVSRGLARSRSEARELVSAGLVTVGGAPAGKGATLVAADQPLTVRPARRWASRGGGKLDAALTDLGVDVAGHHALDAGASTGGFTDVLLERGAATVVAVDVGYGQLDWRLRTDDRVVVLDRTNVRHLEPEQVPAPRATRVVADLSFISLTLVLPALVAVAGPRAQMLLLVKPQFEAEPDDVGRTGVVRDPVVWRRALERVVSAADAQGLALEGAVPSAVPGPAGNIEFFVHLRADAPSRPDAAAAIDHALSVASKP